MVNLALINELIGLPPNASEHGYQIDHIIEFSHWFMGALFVGWSLFFIYVLVRFRLESDELLAYDGWYVDNVHVNDANCTPVLSVVPASPRTLSLAPRSWFRIPGMRNRR